ncbi:hypothetical protein HUN39_14205 [Methylocystis sp. FS]|uniref:hypothetical protein n=1 Tax=Methylocystis silviterrae TaxID=2743612 RepID=UPI001583F0BA|nr:hypothetical protein [Methylocystis silviterrae]NUJ81167.1 hypothetical protein [Methylocystis silviterrae]
MTNGLGTASQQLSDAGSYFEYVLKPNKEAFFGAPSNFASTVNLASSLFHFHEWMYKSFKSRLEAEFNTIFPTAGTFWGVVEGTDPRFGYIRDVANASKHVKIGEHGRPRPSTGAHHMANTHIVVLGYGQGGYGTGPYGGGLQVVVEDSGRLVSFDDCAQALFDYWDQLLRKLAGAQTP